MLRFSAWKPARVTNWNLYPIPANSCWKRAMVASSKLSRLFQVGMRSFAPDQIRVRRVGQAASDGRLDATADAIEAFRRALPGTESPIARIDVAGEQVRAVGVGARHDQRGH